MHFHHFVLHIDSESWAHVGRLGRKLAQLFSEVWSR